MSGRVPLEVRRTRRRPEPILGPLEAEVMERLWKRGSGTVREVVDDLGRTRAIAYTTVMTIMSRLHGKGVLARLRRGKTYLYRPALTRQELRARVARDLVRGLVHQFGDLALASFASELESVDAGHRAALRKLVGRDRPSPR